MTDFEPGRDAIDIEAAGLIPAWIDVTAAGGDTVLTAFDGARMTLLGVTLSHDDLFGDLAG